MVIDFNHCCIVCCITSYKVTPIIQVVYLVSNPGITKVGGLMASKSRTIDMGYRWIAFAAIIKATVKSVTPNCNWLASYASKRHICRCSVLGM